jgi:hypothetical protein
VLSDTFPWIQPLHDGCQENRRNWQDLAEKVEMGLTWIDHDTIDKPVEEFSGNIQSFKHILSKLMLFLPHLIIKIIYLLHGSTVLEGPWLPHIWEVS